MSNDHDVEKRYDTHLFSIVFLCNTNNESGFSGFDWFPGGSANWRRRNEITSPKTLWMISGRRWTVLWSKPAAECGRDEMVRDSRKRGTVRQPLLHSRKWSWATGSAHWQSSWNLTNQNRTSAKSSFWFKDNFWQRQQPSFMLLNITEHLKMSLRKPYAQTTVSLCS